MDGYFDKLFCPCRKLPFVDGSAVLVGTSIGPVLTKIFDGVHTKGS